MTTKQQKRKQVSGLEPELASIKKLWSDPANARKHNERNIEAIKASLRRFGQQKPIVVNGDGVVIAGNGTLQAAKDLGWSEISVVRSSLGGADAVAYAIADNRTAELADWDGEVLGSLLKSFDQDELSDLHFDENDITRLLGEDARRGSVDNKGGMTTTRDEYDAKSTKALILYFDDAAYADVVDRLDEVMSDHGLLSHAEALMFMCCGDLDGAQNLNTD